MTVFEERLQTLAHRLSLSFFSKIYAPLRRESTYKTPSVHQQNQHQTQHFRRLMAKKKPRRPGVGPGGGQQSSNASDATTGGAAATPSRASQNKNANNSNSTAASQRRNGTSKRRPQQQRQHQSSIAVDDNGNRDARANRLIRDQQLQPRIGTSGVRLDWLTKEACRRHPSITMFL